VGESNGAPQRQKPVLVAFLVLVVGVIAAAFLLRGGNASDEEAIRAWFQSPAGGGMPEDLASSIHVQNESHPGEAACVFVDATWQSRAVSKCEITTDAPTPVLRRCFVIEDGKVMRGGWQLAALDACGALRFDSRTRELVDRATRARYRLTE